MTELKLNVKLLSLIILIQTAMDLYLCESSLQQDEPNLFTNKPDPFFWSDRLLTYFIGIDANVVESIGLRQNQECLDALVKFKVHPEMKRALDDELEKYTFTY